MTDYIKRLEEALEKQAQYREDDFVLVEYKVLYDAAKQHLAILPLLEELDGNDDTLGGWVRMLPIVKQIAEIIK